MTEQNVRESFDLETCKQVLKDAQKAEYGACAGVFLNNWAPQMLKEIERLQAGDAAGAAAMKERLIKEVETTLGLVMSFNNASIHKRVTDADIQQLLAAIRSPEVTK